jgi:hypothetical protein
MLKQLARLRVHLFFGGAIFIWLLVGVIIGMSSGQHFIQALWNGIKEVRPFEWLMMFLFWYFLATQKTKDEFTDSRFTQLGLTSQK